MIGRGSGNATHPGDVAGAAGAARHPGTPGHPEPRHGWTAGRITVLVCGVLLALVSIGVLAGGGAVLWADQAQRQAGYLTLSTARYATSGYALASGRISLHGGWQWLEPLIGQVRISVTPDPPAKPVFIGVGPAGPVSRFLSGTTYTTISDFGGSGTLSHHGDASPGAPGAAGIWTARSSGPGSQVMRWTPDPGDWSLVTMNADGSAGVAVRASVAISSPFLFQFGVEMLLFGLGLGLLAVCLIVVPVHLARTG
jgi:hypothetical protein